jgi:uncharacterized protein YbaP (TraB family)
VLPAFLAGQDQPGSLLWSIAGEGAAEPSYLYGTVHSRDDRAYGFVEAVQASMAGVSTVAGELDLEASRSAGLKLMGAMMLPDGKELKDLYKKKEWDQVEAYLLEELGPMASMMMRMKPFLIMATMSEASMAQDRPKVLDDHLLTHAKQQGKRVIGLETLEEQLAAIDALSLKEQAAMLLDHVRNDGHKGMMDQLMEAYVAQDLEALMKLTEASGTMPRKLEQALLTERNERMAHRMDSVMHADGSATFLVGAAHLPGDAGIITLLRQRGLTVEPLPLESGPAKEPLVRATHLARGIHYTSTQHGFSVDMPAMPRLSEGTGEMRWSAVVQEAELTVLVGEPVNAGGDPDLDAWLARDHSPEMLATADRTPLQGHEARRLTMGEGERVVSMLLTKVLGRLLMLSVVGDAERGGQVLDSFRLHPAH